MKAEIRKMIALPTPRWTAIVVLACVVITAVIVFFAGPGENPVDIASAAIGIPLWIASIVIGAWIIGVEYGQKTMRRTLTADPRRLRLLAAKLGVALGYMLILSVLSTLLAVVLLNLAAAGHTNDFPAGDLLEVGLGAISQNLIYVVVGFFLALFTRSMAGGMTVALAFGFIVDSALSAIPKVGQYSLSHGATDIYASIVGTELAGVSESPDLGLAVLVVAAWLAGFALIAGLRFLRTDVV